MSLHCWQAEPPSVQSHQLENLSLPNVFFLRDINRELEAVKVSRKSCRCLILCCFLP